MNYAEIADEWAKSLETNKQQSFKILEAINNEIIGEYSAQNVAPNLLLDDMPLNDQVDHIEKNKYLYDILRFLDCAYVVKHLLKAFSKEELLKHLKGEIK